MDIPENILIQMVKDSVNGFTDKEYIEMFGSEYSKLTYNQMYDQMYDQLYADYASFDLEDICGYFKPEYLKSLGLNPSSA